ncbi:PhzF family phenazine biosynthesis isomerase [Clostridium sp. YIM B02506]|uniref:PhzF family phenazine biosynthesis isomerase n=1 Tax=Clostridium sp. YIM B02506 TaxID=2910680 RepID=UPI001EED6025|nr:PhzF family phenazine biosynthesis isomerase [Clostridium sp. YIM B02506]
MKKVIVYHYDAFCKEPGKGNPAGVVISQGNLTEEEMQEVAYKVGFNETAFVIKSQKADLEIRYFTPGSEMNLCGHATVATLFCMKEKGLLKDTELLTIDTKAGVLPIKIENSNIRMTQSPPKFEVYTGSKESLADAVGIQVKDIDETLPIVYGSTGIWTLLVPVVGLKAFSCMKPNNSLFPKILKQKPNASIHPFCLETIYKESHMHARHFSSPYSGTIEDPVTGTASGVMGAYYLKYINPNVSEAELIVEQGQEIGRDGKVLVHIKEEDNIKVEISGSAVYVNEMTIEI